MDRGLSCCCLLVQLAARKSTPKPPVQPGGFVVSAQFCDRSGCHAGIVILPAINRCHDRPPKD
jgi:hypothetical protein